MRGGGGVWGQVIHFVYLGLNELAYEDPDFGN